MGARRFAIGVLVLLTASLVAGTKADETIIWINLREDVQITGTVVRLADIAEISSLDERLASRAGRLDVGSFEMGRERIVLERESLRTILAEKGLRGEGVVIRGAERVVVRPTVQSISGDRLRRLCETHVREVLTGREIDSIRSLAPLRDVTIPSGRFHVDMEVAADRNNALYAGRVDLEVHVMVDGRTVDRIAVPMQIERRGLVAVATRRIPRGRQIALEDLELQEVSLARLGAGAVERLEDAVGQTARVDIARGQALVSAQLRAQPVIRRDDIVTARISIGALKVTALCRALAEGAPGDRIALENVESRKRIHAIVVDSKTVDAILNP